MRIDSFGTPIHILPGLIDAMQPVQVLHFLGREYISAEVSDPYRACACLHPILLFNWLPIFFDASHHKRRGQRVTRNVLGVYIRDYARRIEPDAPHRIGYCCREVAGLRGRPGNFRLLI
jgi:hypothetical protein